MTKEEIKALEKYLIQKNHEYGSEGLSREDVKRELMLDPEECEQYLKKKFRWSISDCVQILRQMNKDYK